MRVLSGSVALGVGAPLGASASGTSLCSLDLRGVVAVSAAVPTASAAVSAAAPTASAAVSAVVPAAPAADSAAVPTASAAAVGGRADGVGGPVGRRAHGVGRAAGGGLRRVGDVAGEVLDGVGGAVEHRAGRRRGGAGGLAGAARGLADELGDVLGRVLEGVLEPVVRRRERGALQRVLDAVLDLVEARPAQPRDEALAALGEAVVVAARALVGRQGAADGVDRQGDGLAGQAADPVEDGRHDPEGCGDGGRDGAGHGVCPPTRAVVGGVRRAAGGRGAGPGPGAPGCPLHTRTRGTSPGSDQP